VSLEINLLARVQYMFVFHTLVSNVYLFR